MPVDVFFDLVNAGDVEAAYEIEQQGKISDGDKISVLILR
jgi:hypothetical protein